MENLAHKAEMINAEPTDYLNEVDNLMYCGKCNTPKQMKIRIPFIEGKDTVYCLCKCQLVYSYGEMLELANPLLQAV